MVKKILGIAAMCLTLQTYAQTSFDVPENAINAYKFRGIGPAFTSGRVSDLAVHPKTPSTYYVGVASGGVWKTENYGTTYQPIFDGQSSYSIGCISLAPSNPNIVWVGTGENNNQRSVAYGDGVYKSEDGGKSWENMGLKRSEHIGKILIHPKKESTVYVAAYGPLWSEGGERGVYKSKDGGETWERVLYIDEHTGISDLVMDPKDPKTLYAAAHQRRRHVFTYIGGGPSSGIYKTTDGGKTWEELKSGLPTGEMGRIGLAIPKKAPNRIYAIVEAMYDQSGVYRSDDYGASFSKQSSYKTSGNYYQEIVCDPKNPDRIFFMDTWLHHSEDGGKTVVQTGEKHKHVDNHAMWIDPKNTDHWILGCDGGIYETWNAASDWHFKPNLPITQFYKVATDNDYPFYNIYGGTQDNNTIGGPSQTLNNAGIVNSDWFITNGGDGFEAQVDPTNPNIVYAQSQYGWLVRFDKATGTRVGIKPQPEKGEAAYRWNWDAPLLISPHNPSRLYFAANKLFKSDNKGNDWKSVSPDLTRQLDRNTLDVMGRVWSIDAVMKNRSTTIFGNIVALDESPIQEGLLLVGTDDGLIQISENGGESWRKIESIKGVPPMTYVNMLIASKHDKNRIYALFNNHKRGDFKPYVFVSNDLGKSWTNLSEDLPERGSTYCMAEDPENENLLFVGTEFGVHMSLDRGKNWTNFSNGLPTIAIRDMEIQERESDLVLASFGRGFFVLDDFSPLRELKAEDLKKEAFLVTADTHLVYFENNPIGLRGKSAQGESYFTAPNPEVGAVFTYYLKEAPKTLKDERKKAEANRRKEGEDNPYPSFDKLRAEENEEDPYLLFIIKDDAGNVVRKLREKPGSGTQRITWDARHATTTPIQLGEQNIGRYSSPDQGPLALPGKYTVELHLYQLGELKQLTQATSFVIEHLNHQTLPVEDKAALLAFQQEVSELRRSVRGSSKLLQETRNRLEYIEKAIEVYPSIPMNLLQEVEKIESDLEAIELALWGDGLKSTHQFETLPGIQSRIETIVWSSWNALAAPTDLHRKQLEIAEELYQPVLNDLHEAIRNVGGLEDKLNQSVSPYTPGRDDSWRED